MSRKLSPAGTATPAASAADGPITKDNYLERCIAVIRRNPDKLGYIARKDTAQWRSWMGYFAMLDYPTKFARTIDSITVPTEWPHQFDVAASTEIPPEPVAQRRAARGSMHEHEMGRRFEEFAREIAQTNDAYQPTPRRRDWRPPTRDEALERLAELRTADHVAPPLSDAALAKVGARRTEEAA